MRSRMLLRPLRGFNSIKVRLERTIELHWHTRLMFQFHKGTIRTQVRAYELIINERFNSIKVRLEHQATIDNIVANTFQFHKGTIRTGQSPQVASSPAEFQFHKGTIRTREVWKPFPEFLCFNSIKVRLEQSIITLFASTSGVSIP